MALAIAIERGAARLVVSGSAAAMTAQEATRGWGGDLFASRALAWLAGRLVPPAVPEKDGDRVRLALAAGTRRAVAALAVGAVPLVTVALLWLAGRRRRPPRARRSS